jgi:hypothetical protein
MITRDIPSGLRQGRDKRMKGERVELLDEVRVGRNFIRVGDVVKVKSRPGKRDAHEGTVRQIQDRGDRIVLQVIASKRFEYHGMDRIERVAQTRNGEKREARHG